MQFLFLLKKNGNLHVEQEEVGLTCFQLLTLKTSHFLPHYVVVVVGPTHLPKNGGRVQQPFLRTPADGIPPI